MYVMLKHVTLRFLVVLFLWCITTGCSKVTEDSYARLRIGMSYEEAVAILGKTDQCAEVYGGMTCSWGGEGKCDQS